MTEPRQDLELILVRQRMMICKLTCATVASPAHLERFLFSWRHLAAMPMESSGQVAALWTGVSSSSHVDVQHIDGFSSKRQIVRTTCRVGMIANLKDSARWPGVTDTRYWSFGSSADMKGMHTRSSYQEGRRRVEWRQSALMFTTCTTVCVSPGLAGEVFVIGLINSLLLAGSAQTCVLALRGAFRFVLQHGYFRPTRRSCLHPALRRVPAVCTDSPEGQFASRPSSVAQGRSGCDGGSRIIAMPVSPLLVTRFVVDS